LIPSRRLAVGLAGAMVLAALGAEWMRPVARRSEGALPLDRLFPRGFAGWSVDERAERLVTPASAQGKVQGLYDEVLERTYVSDDGARIMLLAAEGGEQSAGMQVHRPEVCYPGNGFRIKGLERVTLHPVGHALPGMRLHAFLPGRSEPVTYWVILGGQAAEDAVQFRLRQMHFGLRRQWLDGLLVRLSSIDTDVQRAYACHRRFVHDLARVLPIESRRRVLGFSEV
jgi:EpsI family protein